MAETRKMFAREEIISDLQATLIDISMNADSLVGDTSLLCTGITITISVTPDTVMGYTLEKHFIPNLRRKNNYGI